MTPREDEHPSSTTYGTSVSGGHATSAAFKGSASVTKPLSLTMTNDSATITERLLDSSEENGNLEDEDASYQVPEDKSSLHLVCLIAITSPWYLYTALQMTIFNVPQDFFGLDPLAVKALGIYVFASQLGVYATCAKLSNATTLVEAQHLVWIMFLLCVPADVIGTLYEPTGSPGLTVLAFAGVTFCFGIFLAHYLRKAAFRQTPPDFHHVHDESLTIVETLQQYRPPAHAQATHMAAEFTRAFVSFTISVGALGQFFAHHAHGNGAHDWIIVSSLMSVVVHTSVECFLTTTYPGAELDEYDSFLLFESVLYAIHMFASSIVAHQEGFGDSLVDQILFAWLFGSATAKLIDRLGKFLGKVNFDEKLGLSKLD